MNFETGCLWIHIYFKFRREVIELSMDQSFSDGSALAVPRHAAASMDMWPFEINTQCDVVGFVEHL